MVDCDSERIWKVVESYRLNVPKRKRQQTDGSPSLFDRLYDCYVDCNQTASDKSADKRFRNAVHLLERLSPGHAHPSLIVNLYSDEQGYSLVLSPKKGSESEEFFLPYEDNEIFSYLDNQELPPVLVEVLGQTKYCHMYNGCVVCEVRDHRNFSCSSGSYDRHLLLLRPTAETILSTVEEMAYETSCSSEDKLMLESRLLLATQPPICLDPSTDVVCFTNRLQYNQRKFHTPGIRRTLRKRSHARRARMHMTSEGVAPCGLQLHDFIAEKTRAEPRERRRDFSSSWKKAKVDYQLQDTPEAVFASVLRLAKPVTPPPLIEHQKIRHPSVTHQPKPHPPVVSRPSDITNTARDTVESSTDYDRRRFEATVQSTRAAPPVVSNEAQLQGRPPPALSSHVHVAPGIAEQQQHQPISHAHHAPPTTHPSVISPPPTSVPSLPRPPSQPHPLTPTPTPPPRIHPSMPTSAIPSQTPPPPSSLPQIPPAPPPSLPALPPSLQAPPPSLQAPPPPAAVPGQTQQPQMINYGGVQLPASYATNPELLKLFLAQLHASKKPRPIAPAVVKPPTVEDGSIVAVKPKPPPSLVKPPPLSQGSSSGVVVVPRSGGSSIVQGLRPPLVPLATPPPNLTPSPKRPKLTHPSQNVPPAQAGMPKLHPLSQDTSLPKSALPLQPALNKPVAPPPPSSSLSMATAPPTMPTLHKITSAVPTPLQLPPKATPNVGGVIPAPPLKASPNVMPKLMTSHSQMIKPPSALPVLSKPPAPLRPPPPPKLHPPPTTQKLHPPPTTKKSGEGSVASSSVKLSGPPPLQPGKPAVAKTGKPAVAKTSTGKSKSSKHGSKSHTSKKKKK